jgi:hypothetical protein
MMKPVLSAAAVLALAALPTVAAACGAMKTSELMAEGPKVDGKAETRTEVVAEAPAAATAVTAEMREAAIRVAQSETLRRQ